MTKIDKAFKLYFISKC